MKKIYAIISLIVLLSIFSVGCTSRVNQLFTKGEEALKNQEYKEARDFFAEYLNQEDPKDDTVRAMYKQAYYLNKAVYYKDNGYYDKSLECLDKIANIDSGSRDAKADANKLKKEVQALKDEYDSNILAKRESAKDVALQSVKKAEQEYYIWQQTQQQETEQQETEQEGEQPETGEIIDAIKDRLEGLINKQ